MKTTESATFFPGIFVRLPCLVLHDLFTDFLNCSQFYTSFEKTYVAFMITSKHESKLFSCLIKRSALLTKNIHNLTAINSFFKLKYYYFLWYVIVHICRYLWHTYKYADDLRKKCFLAPKIILNLIFLTILLWREKWKHS